MGEYILGIDQGTTGSTAMIFDTHSKRIVKSVNKEFPQIYPKPGWVEHNLNDIWESVKSTISECIEQSQIKSSEIISIGITNQRETTCLFNKDGDPLHNAIVWQDRRTSEFCRDNTESYKELKKLNGLPLDPYFSGTKLKWLLENNNFQDPLFGTIDTFLLYKLTSGQSHFTEPSNASRTLLMNLETCNWDDKLLSYFNIPESVLPKIKNTFDDFGHTSSIDFLPDGIPINCLFGDQQSALFGQAAINTGEMKCTYGTGAFLLLNTGESIKYSENGLLTTLAYKHIDQKVYAIEGSTYIAGAAVQFLRDNLTFFKDAKDIESFARKSQNENTKELFLFPFFTGMGSPYWNADAKASIYGMTRGTSKEDISKACLEGIALSINDLIEALEKDLGRNINSINVDGGAVKNDFLMEIQATVSQKKILRPKIIETTALGAIFGALIGSGKLQINQLKDFWELDKEFNPVTQNIDYLSEKVAVWKKLCSKLF